MTKTKRKIDDLPGGLTAAGKQELVEKGLYPFTPDELHLIALLCQTGAGTLIANQRPQDALTAAKGVVELAEKVKSLLPPAPAPV